MKNSFPKFILTFALVLTFSFALTHNTFAAPQSGGVFTVNSASDENTKDEFLTFREALLISNGGSGPNGLGRTMSDGEKAQLNGCTMIGSAGTWSIVSGCGAGVQDTIAFNFTGRFLGYIDIEAGLPVISDAVVIDGYTEPGAIPNTSKKGDNAKIIVSLIGSNAGTVHGLVINSQGSVIKGLMIAGFKGEGIQIAGGSNNVIEGNWIFQNGAEGIYVASPNNVIGGDTVAARNVVINNGLTGISLGQTGANTTIKNNIVGGKLNKKPFGNKTIGIQVSSSNNSIVLNTVGYNANAGIVILSGTGNRLEKNSITNNSGAGIDLNENANANNSQNRPSVSLATSATKTVTGKLAAAANTQFQIELFGNKKCDASQYGEGKKFLGAVTVTTNANGIAKFSVVVKKFQAGNFITATATDPNGNTSEFSKCATAK